MVSRLMYVELKTGYQDNGPAWIGKARFSKSGQTVFFNGLALKRIRGGGIQGNHLDAATGTEYWVSGVKKDGKDRHWAGSGQIMIDEKVVDEYLTIVGRESLNKKKFQVRNDFMETDIGDHDEQANRDP